MLVSNLSLSHSTMAHFARSNNTVHRLWSTPLFGSPNSRWVTHLFQDYDLQWPWSLQKSAGMSRVATNDYHARWICAVANWQQPWEKISITYEKNITFGMNSARPTILKYERILTPLARSHTMQFPSCPAEKRILGSKGCGSRTNTSSSCPCCQTT